MKIGITAHGTRGLRSGLGHYLRNILRVLLRDHPEHEYVVYCQEAEADAFRFPELDLAPEFQLGSARHASALYDILWHNLVLPRTAQRQGVDVLFIAVDRRIPFFSRVPVVATVHDLAAFTVGDKYPLTRQIYSRRVLPVLIRRADHLIAVSDATRNDVIEHLGIPPERIERAHNGVEPGRFRRVDANAIPPVLERYGIRSPYILYTARLEHPGKNHVGLIRALSRIESGRARDYTLVFAGNPWHNVEPIERAVVEEKLENRVVFTGFVEEEDLPILYQGAELFVFPSLYEGFGIPLLEAMAAGVPMAVARTSSLPEVAGDAAEYFDPCDPEDIARAITRLSEDPGRRSELIEAGTHRVEQFTWEDSAEKTLQAICGASSR